MLLLHCDLSQIHDALSPFDDEAINDCKGDEHDPSDQYLVGHLSLGDECLRLLFRYRIPHMVRHPNEGEEVEQIAGDRLEYPVAGGDQLADAEVEDKEVEEATSNSIPCLALEVGIPSVDYALEEEEHYH